MSKDIKVVVLGLTSVGKSCLVQRFMYNNFEHTVMTVGGAYSCKRIQVGNNEVYLGIWDTAGTERYEAVNRSYYRRARAAIVCYDLTNLSSLDKVTFWVEELTHNEPNIDIYIVGNKLDLIQEGEKRQVTQQQVDEIANKYNAVTLETSSKTGENINLLLQTIAENFVKKYPNEVQGGGNVNNNSNNNNGSGSVNMNSNSKKSGGCC
ncbi:Rab GTPase [Cavenderia fasciculata]|uniref:Rab GTPase n=1 Tax=Cavenderia fasciculata TaxID=261658 RepID=F4PQW7_CACFS|nr:Rab GTPase [Cavenderia fasciculata]EGG21232.1 Rab GTPase [Cavenderia fasciculata]|eukprot:XP_004359082.1 Rab GTPase [Cavenderia fasciculata]